jgi:glycosyltransferase involved in cell wall biosynthesis
MRPLHIAYVFASLRASGAEKQMLTLAERLPRDRFDVDFLVLSDSGAYDARGEAAQARVWHLGSALAPNARLPARLARRGWKSMRYSATARGARYDIIDAWLYPVDVMAALLRSVTRTPVVIAGRRNLGDFHDRYGRLRPLIVRLANQLTDAVVANSDAVAADVLKRERLDPRKLRIIRNGVELIEGLRADERTSRRRALGMPDDGLVVGCVASFQPVKRHDLLIDAFASLVEAEPRARLLLVGDGPLRTELQRRIHAAGLEERVRLHGWELDPRPLYGTFDLVVQASRSEGLPNALLEAAAAGLPIVATAAGGTREIIVDGQTGLLVPINDGEALARALRRAASDRSLRERLGANARQHVARAFGIERFVAEFTALYEELAAAKRLYR